MRKLILINLIILICTFVNSFANTIKIKVKISDKIITNIDIENEKKYLIFLNPKLEELEKSRVDNIAKDSLITEIIKKNELEKFFDFNDNNNLINNVEKNFLSKKILKVEKNLKKYLKLEVLTTIQSEINYLLKHYGIN